MPETCLEEARSPTEVWTDEVVALFKEAVLSLFEHGPGSEQHLEASQQLWTALEVFAMVKQAVLRGGEDALKPADSALARSHESLPPPGDGANCVRCGRVLTPESMAQGEAECSAHALGKVEIRRPQTRT